MIGEIGLVCMHHQTEIGSTALMVHVNCMADLRAHARRFWWESKLSAIIGWDRLSVAVVFLFFCDAWLLGV